MTEWIALPAAIGLLLVFVASMAARESIRLPRRMAAPHEDEAMRVVHRGLTAHIAMTLACGGAVLAAPVLGTGGLAVFVAALFIARASGLAIASRRPRFVAVLLPILAPVDGAALLLDWVLSPLLHRDFSQETAAGAGPVVADPYEQVLELSRRTVEQVMIPRSEVVWIRASAGAAEILEVLRTRPHSSYPVFEGDFEQLAGMLELAGLLLPLRPGVTAAAVARPAVVVPETMGCDDLLERMRRDRFDVAAVVDEFGGMAGLVTLEDVLEVMLGELTGEHETVPVRTRRMEDGSYLVDATLRIDEFDELFQTTLPEGDYETLAGLFLSRTARIPSAGEKIEVGELRLEVAEADARRIRTLRVFPKKAADSHPARARSSSVGD